MTDTSIEWCHRPGTRAKTWNPTDGCDVCSPGCANCYAMRMAGRFSGPGRPYHGLVTIAKNKRAIWNGEGRFNADRLALPLSWRSPCTVFVNSMSDLFYDAFTDEQIAAVFGVMAATPQHTFIVLTKRAARMRAWFEWVQREAAKAGPGAEVEMCVNCADEHDAIGARIVIAPPWPLPNVWLGVSVENQAAADERIPELLRTPAAIRFLSCEPLLGPVDVRRWTERSLMPHDRTGHATAAIFGIEFVRKLDWVIAGCESGPGARPIGADAFRSLRDQCAAAGVPYFLKQARSEMADTGTTFGNRPTGAQFVVHAGTGSRRKPGGVIGAPYLDGVQHLNFPEVP